MLAPVAALLVAGVIAAVVTNKQDGAANAADAGSQTPSGPQPVLIDTASYVGLPIDEVEATLTALGLVVVRDRSMSQSKCSIPPGCRTNRSPRMPY